MMFAERTNLLILGKEAVTFRGWNTAEALQNCQQAGYDAAFAPQIADARIEATDKEAIWDMLIDTASVIVSGETRTGRKVVVVAHVPNYFSNPNNIKASISFGLVGYYNGAGIMPLKEFYQLINKEDGSNVFVLDHQAVINAGWGNFEFGDARRHPLAVAFMGGRDRLERYLNQHERVAHYKEHKERIGIRYNDKAGEVPVGRLLAFGSCFLDMSFMRDLVGYKGLDDGHGSLFVGLPRRTEGTEPEQATLEERVRK